MLCNLPPQVAGVPMTVLSTSTIFEKTKRTTQLYARAACPQAQGNVKRLTDVMSSSVFHWECGALFTVRNLKNTSASIISDSSFF